MSKRKLSFFTWIFSTVLLAISAAIVLAADPPKVGDKVEIKFGDSWIEATVTWAEGERVRARSAGGAESWFGPGEFRAPGKTMPAVPDKPADPPVGPASSGPKAGESIEVSFAATWLHAKVLKVEGNRVQAKLDSGMERWFGPKEFRLLPKIDPKFYASLAAGSKVEVHDGHSWLVSTVKKREANRFFIHYDEWPDSWDTWVPPDRVRPRKEAMGQWAKMPAGAGGGAAQPGVIETASGSVALGDMSGVKELSSDQDGVWRAKPEVEPPPPALKSPLALGTKFSSDSEKVSRVQFTGSHVLVTLVHEDAFKPSKARIARVRLPGGGAEPVVELPPGQRVTDFSPDGSRALLRRAVADVPNCLELFTLTGLKPPREVAWKPHSSQDHEGDLPLAAFVDATHVLSCDTQGDLILWELPGDKPAAAPAGATTRPTSQPASPRPRAIYHMKVGNYIRPVLSPQRSMFAVEVKGKVRLFDSLTGSPLGSIAEAANFRMSLAFNSACTMLAVTTPNRMTFVDVASGKSIRQIPLPAEFTKPSLAAIWLSSGSLLLGHQYLVSPSQRLVLWSYEFPSRSAAAIESYAGGLWYVAGDGLLALHSVKLPHDEATRAVANVKVDDLLVFRRGDTVSLDITSDAPGDTRTKIQESLEKQIREMGLTVGGGGLHIIASTTPGETKQMEYRIFGGGVQKVSVTEKTHQLKVELDGKEVWSTSNKAGASFMISAKQGQSFDDAVRESQERSYQWLAAIKVPTDLVRPDGYKVQGSSKVTAKGVE